MIGIMYVLGSWSEVILGLARASAETIFLFKHVYSYYYNHSGDFMWNFIFGFEDIVVNIFTRRLF